jgi:hypothetical protein
MRVPDQTATCPACGHKGLVCKSPADVYQAVGTTIYDGKRHLDYGVYESEDVEFTGKGTIFCENPQCDWSCHEDQLLQKLVVTPLKVWP